MSCRTDAFGGTDIPYTSAVLTTLNGAPGGISGCDLPGGGAPTSFLPPYTPSPNSTTCTGAAPTPCYPSGSNSTARVMTLPITGGAVAIAIHLGTVACPAPATIPTSVTLTALDLSKLYGGDFATWNQLSDPGLAGCTGAITRVVRLDKSGTTQTFKNGLRNMDGNRTLCDAGANAITPDTWGGSTPGTGFSADANNTVWPSGGTCANNLDAKSGTGAVVTETQAVDGAVGYGDLSAWPTTGVIFANLTTATGSTIGPGSPGGTSNCDLGAKGLPGSTNNDAVGLNTTSSWASDAATLVSDITFPAGGTGYPVCALTWDMVYTRLNSGAVANPIGGLTADQRQSLYSYFIYVFSPLGQSKLTTVGYDQLPLAWLQKVRDGFRANF
jgi:hypothetical protein